MRILAFLFITLFWGFGSQAQTWNKEFGTLIQGWSDIAINVEYANDSIYLVYSDSNPSGGRRVNFCNISLEGDVNWVKTLEADSTIRQGGDANSTDYSETLNQNVLAQQFLKSDGEGGSYFFGELVLMNQYYDTLYTRLIGDSISIFSAVQARFTSDEGIAVVGWTNAETNTEESQTLLIKYNNEGEQEWQTTHGLPSYVHLGFSVVELPNGHFVTGSGHYLEPDIAASPILTLFDENGNYLDYRIFGSEEYGEGWAKINLTTDGNIIMCASKQENDDEDLFYLAKIDSSLSIIWEQSYDLGSPATAFKQIKENEDGSFIGVGIWVDPLTGYEFGIILKFDSLGNLLWQRKYQHADTGWAQLNVLYDVAEIPDNGGYVACGQRNELDTGQNAWVIKVDDMGCLVEGCDTISSVAELTNLSSLEITTGPNPATDYVNVFIPELPQEIKSGTLELKLRSLDGKVLRSQEVTTSDITYIVDVNDHARGVYFLSLVYEGEVISTNKIILE